MSMVETFEEGKQIVAHEQTESQNKLYGWKHEDKNIS